MGDRMVVGAREEDGVPPMERALADDEGRAFRDKRGYAHGPRLTVEERRALELSAIGLGVTAVAEALRQPPATVRQSLEAARKQLGARSKLEAVVIGLRHGLIDPPAW